MKFLFVLHPLGPRVVSGGIPPKQSGHFLIAKTILLPPSLVPSKLEVCPGWDKLEGRLSWAATIEEGYNSQPEVFIFRYHQLVRSEWLSLAAYPFPKKCLVVFCKSCLYISCMKSYEVSYDIYTATSKYRVL